jgi:hypothetical protein
MAPLHESIMFHAKNEVLSTPGMSLREKITRSTDAFLELRAHNLPLQFYLSTLTGLGDLVEDEIIPNPLPMKVSSLGLDS